MNSWIGNYSYSRARISPDKTALVDLDANKSFTYSELDKRANQLANLLKEDYGVCPKDRVAFVSGNRTELIDAYYATGKIGAILVPYNARLSEVELGTLLLKEEPKVVFYEENYRELLVEALKLCPDILSFELSNSREDNEYEKALASKDNKAVSYKEADIEDIHMIIHTGGTTGLPKGALLSHRAEIFNSFNEICTWGLNYEDSAVLLLPMFHTGGWNLVALPLLHAGGTLYISSQFDPGLTLEVIEREKTTIMFGAATIFRMLSEHKNFESSDLSSLKWVMAGAAPTPINIMQKFWDKGIKFVLGYGMTEAGPNNLSSPPQFLEMDTIKEKYESVGKPMYLSVAKVIDKDGNTIEEPGIEGELLWAGPQIFSGYWNNEGATQETFKNGWVHSGDMVVFDEEDFYYIVGRKKNMYISGGENVFPPEVEKAMYGITEINEVCVFGVPDEKWGEVGKAVISFKKGKSLSKEVIIDKLKGKLAKYKLPKYIAVVDDVPKNSVGKIVVKDIVEKYGLPKDEE